MSTGNDTLPLPKRDRTEHGAMRRIGVEVEFAGLDIDTIAAILRDHLHGETERDSRYEIRIVGDPAGDWRVEFDQELLKTWARKRDTSDERTAWLEDTAEELLRAGSEQVVPMEVVSPPLPMDRLAEIDPLIAALRKAGALGTRESWVYAFGVHLNPELPRVDAREIAGYLKAFLCLSEWIVDTEAVDLTRRLMPYIDPFPQGYLRRVVDPDYWPDTSTLIDDYLTDNPTRNRALDMLPLFAELDESRVRRAIDDPRIQARPTLHYRLPNCEIDRPGWGIETLWRDWLVVEDLAADHNRLDGLCLRYCEFLDQGLARLLERWPDEVREWLAGPSGT